MLEYRVSVDGAVDVSCPKNLRMKLDAVTGTQARVSRMGFLLNSDA